LASMAIIRPDLAMMLAIIARVRQPG
jgi:hypothetical protein